MITEVAYLLSYSKAKQRAFPTSANRLDIDLATAADLPRIVAIMAKYEDLPADFADASLVAMCERRGISEIATFDTDFEVYRLRGRKRFVRVLQRA